MYNIVFQLDAVRSTAMYEAINAVICHFHMLPYSKAAVSNKFGTFVAPILKAIFKSQIKILEISSASPAVL